MKTNKMMKKLLEDSSQSNEFIDSDLFNPYFDEWDHCILIDASSLNNKSSIKETTYLDRTDLEASMNHYHVHDLETGLQLLFNWKKCLQFKYPEKEFILILSSTLEGEDCVIRFYQLRNDEPEWIRRNDLEGYKEEAILVIEILNAVQ